MAEDEIAPARRHVRTFVLRQRRMTAAQQRAYDNLREKFCLDAAAKFDWPSIFGDANPVVVEIGFGMGGATAQMADECRGKNFAGIEVHKPGVGSLLHEIERRGLSNVRIVEADALDVLARCVPDESVSAFHAFFPDPWPKSRHRKRRLMQRPNTDLLAKKLAAGGCVYFATDWEDYAKSALAELSATDGLANVFSDFAPRQEWRPQTNFERKALAAGRRIFELIFKKA